MDEKELMNCLPPASQKNVRSAKTSIKVAAADTSCVDEGFVTSASNCIANSMGSEEGVSSLIGNKNKHETLLLSESYALN